MTTKLRAAVGSVYPYDESFIQGGVEAVASCLVHALARSDQLELHVVSCNRKVKHDLTEQRGRVTFHWLAAASGLYGLRAITVDAWRVRQVYNRVAPHVIHSQGHSEYAVGAPPHVPLILTMHGLESLVPVMRKAAHFRGIIGFYRRHISDWLISSSIKKSSAVISIAGDYVPRVMGKLLNGKTVAEIGNPVDDAWFGLPNDSNSQRLVLFMGTIIERKNVSGLVEAFAQVVRHYSSARLCIAGAIGQSDYYALVRNQVAALNLVPEVAFPGPLRQDQLLAMCARASVVVLPSIQETAPMAIAQAMAAGKPVVATPVGGVPWMVEDGMTGYLVPVGDSQCLSDRIVELLRDESKRNRMGQAGRETARRLFAADAVAESTVQAYRHLLKGIPT